jgi:hypothetical protein
MPLQNNSKGREDVPLEKSDTQILHQGKKLGHRREKGGEVTYKKFETGQLMGSIQLGIQQSVGTHNIICITK